jgi:glucuronosyltransferase
MFSDVWRCLAGHRNVKVFLTHGGLMGTIEAVHSGVPMVGIPLFGDQEVNIGSYVSQGFAVKLHFNSISKESVLKALKAVLYQPRLDFYWSTV